MELAKAARVKSTTLASLLSQAYIKACACLKPWAARVDLLFMLPGRFKLRVLLLQGLLTEHQGVVAWPVHDFVACAAVQNTANKHISAHLTALLAGPPLP